MTEITMPKLSDTMTEGRFGTWKKSIGEQVNRGDIIAEIETDKAVMELEAFASGILLEQRAKPGELITVGTVIGLVGEKSATLTPSTPEVSAPTPSPVTQLGIGPERFLGEDEASGFPAAIPQQELHQEQAAPVVRRRARELGIDLSQVHGSGPGGRILLDDLQRFSGVLFSEAESPPLPVHPEEETVVQAEAAGMGHIFQGTPLTSAAVPLTRMRSAIARTVSEAWRTIPHFYLTVDVFMEAAEEIRRELKSSGSAVSINDLVVKGTALALAAFPQANASLRDDSIVSHSEINIGMAVSLTDGLLVPVLRGCEHLSLLDIAAQSARLVEKARSGQMSEVDLAGGTFSISNLGMYGTESFAAVVHPPQAAILAVGAVRDAVVAKNGQPAVVRKMKLTLSADHRIVDGAYAARFLGEIKNILETPVRMLV